MALIRERNEHTIAERVSVYGRGYWSGQGVTIRFVPAHAGTGIRFVRTDLPNQPVIDVSVANRVDHALRTVVESRGARVEMIEHVLAALHAMEIDNCVVEVNAAEMPGLDGSSAGYVDALRCAGLVMQAGCRRQIVIDRIMRVGDGMAWVEAMPSPDGRCHLEYRLDYGSASAIPAQSFRCRLTPESFGRELAPARTFVTLQQAQALRESGVGGHVTNRDLLVFDDHGPVDNLLRYPDECARHKALDLIGDLSLVGADLIGSFISYRGGHQLNGAMAQQLCTYVAASPAGCRDAA